MFIYLSKKIAIPNNRKIKCIAWNKEDGYIAVGGDDGLLKVLKLDSGNDNEGTAKSKGLTASNNLSMNRSLEGHSETIRVIAWNQAHQKLTTSDENGIIIVWMLYKGIWYEEMINNRKKSVVVGMSWNSDGSKICIIYEDGAVIVGSVDGDRIWGKELKQIRLAKVQWSPDGKLLLFGLKNGEVHLYDNLGTYIMQLDMLCLTVLNITVGTYIVAMDWYNGKYGHSYSLCPTLAICHENGYVQLMTHESDTNAVLIKTKLNATCCNWNHNGSLLAIAGKLMEHTDLKFDNVIQFYSPFGDHLRTLKLPGLSVTSCSWEEGSLRIAIGIDSCVYFANIRPDYKWCFFKNTVVLSTCHIQKGGVCVIFWDIENNQCRTQYLPTILAVAAYGNHCVLATQSDTNPVTPYSLLVCNTLGTVVDGKYTDLPISWVTMNSSHVVAASKNNYLLWQYKTPKPSLVNVEALKYQTFHIDCDPTGATIIIKDFQSPINTPSTPTHESYDPICCIAVSDKFLIIGKKSGKIKQFTVPHVVVINTFTLPVTPYKIALNCNSTRLSVIDMAGVLTVLNINDTALKTNDGESTCLERKDVWAMCWAADNPQLLAIMEKTRMYIFKGIYPEEPISTAGYICSFENLEILGLLLDEVMEAPEKTSMEHLFRFKIKSLRDTCQLLEKVGIKEAAQFIDDNSHPRLWHLLGEAALKKLNLEMAQEGFVRSHNYSGIQFVKSLHEMSNDDFRKAAIAVYFKKFDKADKIYSKRERRDLALELREILGDWFNVIEMIKQCVPAPKNLLEDAYNYIADYFAYTNDWILAIEYYELANNKTKMIETYYHLQDYKSLEALIEQLQEKDRLLIDIAKIFAVEGDYMPAVKAYLKVGNFDSAINLSVGHHNWDQAIYIAQKYCLHRVVNLLIEYSDHLVKNNKISKAIEINVQSKYYLVAAKYAIKLAVKETKKVNKELIKIKKIYIYAARLIEKYKEDPKPEEITDSTTDIDLIENCWKGAEAFHFYILAQNQLYNHQIHDAVCTLHKLESYTKYIPTEDISALLALAAYLHGLFELCSKMFVRLASLTKISEKEKTKYDNVAFQIFMQYDPYDMEQNKKYVNCYNCQTSICDWEIQCPECFALFSVCISTGCSVISDEVPKNTCSLCHHIIDNGNIGFRKICPLCHISVNSSIF